jgi:hypothetical protein
VKVGPEWPNKNTRVILAFSRAIGHLAAKWPLISAGSFWLSEKGKKGPTRHFGSSQMANLAKWKEPVRLLGLFGLFDGHSWPFAGGGEKNM